MPLTLHPTSNIARRLRQTPVERWGFVAHAMASRIPTLKGRERALMSMIVDRVNDAKLARQLDGPDRRFLLHESTGVREMLERGEVKVERIVAPNGIVLQRAERIIPHVLISSAMKVVESEGQPINAGQIVEGLKASDILQETTNGVNNGTRRILTHGQQKEEDPFVGHAQRLMQRWENYEVERHPALQEMKVSRLLDLVGVVEGRIARGVERGRWEILFPNILRELQVDQRKELQKLTKVHRFLMQYFNAVILQVISGKAEIEVVNETIRCFRDYIDLMVAARQQKTLDREFWGEFEARLLHLYRRLSLLFIAAKRGQRLGRSHIVFPFAYPSLPDIRTRILDDTFALDRFGSETFGRYIVFPEKVFTVDRGGLVYDGEAGKIRRDGLIKIRGVNYDVSALPDCIIIPWKRFARVYDINTGERIAEIKYLGTGPKVPPATPVKVYSNDDFTPLPFNVEGSQKITVSIDKRISFLRKEHSDRNTFPSPAAYIVLSFGICNVYDREGKFLGAVPERDIVVQPGANTTNISELLCGMNWRQLNGVGLVFLDKVQYRLVRQRDVKMKKGKLRYADDLVWKDLLVTPIYPFGEVLVCSGEKRTLIGSFQMRDASAATSEAGVLYVKFDDMADEIPALRSRAVPEVTIGGRNNLNLFGQTLCFGPYPPEGITAQVLAGGEINLSTGRTWLGRATVNPAKNRFAYWDLVRQVPGVIRGEMELYPQANDGLVGIFAAEYRTLQNQPIRVKLNPGRGRIPYGYLEERRFLLDRDPFEPGKRRKSIYVADLLAPFDEVQPVDRYQYYPPGFTDPVTLTVPQIYVNQGWQLAVGTRDHFLFVERRTKTVLGLAERALAQKTLKRKIFPISDYDGVLPQIMDLNAINDILRLMHQVGVRPGSTAREKLPTLNQLSRLMLFSLEYGNEELTYQLATRGTPFIHTLEMGFPF
ncbi:MAG: hypothetical protein KKB81_08315 [Candidatus Margulisbacteria bacterium]|nr:hypothetical protein [Candidatus Margulisiibacteriota bacterium]MBU1021700.1 hypothetical protein [Candidatus Margulisiibacteriota bacterium]MBU1729446.1 hypothetical protein [Candidatus Margulisiibacteriota bacterium]MBU1955453.1 hypothetical protein [Candidatus Margulisiibacteriota bacterium]